MEFLQVIERLIPAAAVAAFVAVVALNRRPARRYPDRYVGLPGALRAIGNYLLFLVLAVIFGALYRLVSR